MTYDELQELEKQEKAWLIETTCHGCVQLWQHDDNEYVVLSDNTVITRQEDNEETPFFPY
ncbi:MAG: hypothetical protein GY853_15880 [PVC group bacterium]|nr:hypothetical protein [PVC group bacterium]